MNITAIGTAGSYSPTNTSQNETAAGSAQSSTPAGGGAPSGGTSQATSSSTSSSSSTTKTSALYDPMDLNQDGIVTYAEEMQYLLSHPLANLQDRESAIQSYNQQAQTTGTSGSTQSIVNIYA